MKRAPETKSRDSLAYAPRFFLSMLFALVAFAVVTYLATGSFATTAIQTLVCAVLIQVGYFLTMLYLVRQEAKARKSEADGSKPDLDKATPKVPVTMNEPGHSKF
jgi:exopolysaccharide production repressor protein